MKNLGFLVAMSAVFFCAPVLSSNWQYVDSRDEGKTASTAFTTAARQKVKGILDPSISLTMTVVNQHEKDSGVVFTLDSDQLDCSGDNCVMSVQFDVGTGRNIDIVAVGPTGEFAPVNATAFAGALTMAQRLSIELALRSRGIVRFELDVADLKLRRKNNPAFVFAGMKLGEVAAAMPGEFKPDQLSPALNCRKASDLRDVIPGQGRITARVCLFAGLFYQLAIETKNREEYESTVAYLSRFYGGTGFDSANPASLIGAGDISRYTSHVAFWRKNNAQFEGYFYVTDDVIDFLVPKNLKLMRSVKKPTL